jgi:hypothetical protein
MNIENVFKNIIKIQFLFAVVIIISAFFEDLEYVELDVVSETLYNTLSIWSLIYLVVYVVNLYFLYKFKPIGKTLYLPLIILGFILSSLFPYEQSTSVDFYIEWMDGLLSGLVIALLYFTDIKDKFKET